MGNHTMRFASASLLVACAALAVVATAEQASDGGLASEGGCAEATKTCQAALRKHGDHHAHVKAKAEQCLGETVSKHTQLESLVAGNQDLLDKIDDAERKISGIASESTEEEAEDTSMSDLLSENEEMELKESNTDNSPTGLKDALQKAEAVLTYNRIQSSRLFKT